MAGKSAEELGLTAVEEVRRCMCGALNRFKIETEKRLKEFNQLNVMFMFLKLNMLLLLLLLSENNINETSIDTRKNVCEDDIVFSELIVFGARANGGRLWSYATDQK